MADMKYGIEQLAAKAAKTNEGVHALQFSQAALNLANAARVIADMPKP